MKKTPTQIAKELREINHSLQDQLNSTRRAFDNTMKDLTILFITFCGLFAVSMILVTALANMDKKFNQQKRYISHLEYQEERRLEIQRAVEEEEYTAKLCKELARVSGRPFTISDGDCLDSKIGFRNNRQIVDAIAHYMLIKTDKK
jgi:hypothetical protein